MGEGGLKIVPDGRRLDLFVGSKSIVFTMFSWHLGKISISNACLCSDFVLGSLWGTLWGTFGVLWDTFGDPFGHLGVTWKFFGQPLGSLVCL